MKHNLKFHLRGKLSEKELKLVPSSYDVVGDIMIFADFSKELNKKEKLIGQSILEFSPHIKVVMKKTRKYSGRFRLAKLKIIAGEKRSETVHKENDVFIKLDVEKVYFSPRMSTERKRIANLVGKDENVLVMFSGCGPFPLVIAKNSNCGEIIGVEINPKAHEYGLFNIKKNKLDSKIKLFCGDVDKAVPKLRKKFNRILMPLPKGGERFLGLAIRHLKKKGIIHFYDFLNENEFIKAIEKIAKACKKFGKDYKIIDIVKCGQYAPGFFRICVDFKIV